jgi:putative ABC transport system ATP-binding protein
LCNLNHAERGTASTDRLFPASSEASVHTDAAGKAALLTLSGIHKHYRYGQSVVHALCDIHMQVAAGEMVAVCAPSGHGKTTLLNLIGLLEQPSAGSVRIDGIDVAALGQRARDALRVGTIGVVFQCFTLLPVLTALDNVLLPLLLRGRLQQPALCEARAFATELLARLGLASQLHYLPARLNPGQCQRVAIARALVMRPRLVLADEPASRLDASALRLVLELWMACQREQGTAFVIATRDQRQLHCASRTLQLADGRLGLRPADFPRQIPPKLTGKPVQAST